MSTGHSRVDRLFSSNEPANWQAASAGMGGNSPRDPSTTSPEYDDSWPYKINYQLAGKIYAANVMVGRIKGVVLGQAEANYAIVFIANEINDGENKLKKVEFNAPENRLLETLGLGLNRIASIARLNYADLENLATKQTLEILKGAHALLYASTVSADPFDAITEKLGTLEVKPGKGNFLNLDMAGPLRTTDSGPSGRSVKSVTLATETALTKLSFEEILAHNTVSIVSRMQACGFVSESNPELYPALRTSIAGLLTRCFAPTFEDSQGYTHSLKDAKIALENKQETDDPLKTLEPWSEVIAKDILNHFTEEFNRVSELSELVPLQTIADFKTLDVYRLKQSLVPAIGFFIMDNWLPVLETVQAKKLHLRP
jgi:hypothetical protein